MDRGALITGLVTRISGQCSDFKLVKPYEGELQSGDERFLKAVNGQLPCALVVMDATSDNGSANMSLRVSVSLNVFIAVKDFTGRDHMPDVYPLLDAVVSAVHGYAPGLHGAGDYRFQGDRHMAHNDFYTLYTQAYAINCFYR